MKVKREFVGLTIVASKGAVPAKLDWSRVSPSTIDHIRGDLELAVAEFEAVAAKAQALARRGWAGPGEAR